MSYTTTIGTIEGYSGHIVLSKESAPEGEALGYGRDVPVRSFQPLSPVPSQSPMATPGFVFFSPAVAPNAGAEVDVSSVLIASRAADRYRPPLSQTKAMKRPFVLGPAPASPSSRAWPPHFSASYKPVLNSAYFGLMSSKLGFAVRGVLVNTSTMETTVVFV